MMRKLWDRISSTLGNLVLGTGLQWGLALLGALILSMLGARTVADLLEKVPWSYVGVLVAAFLGLFLGGFFVESRHVTRSSKLVHWLSRNAPREDMDRLDWVLGLLRKGKPRIEGQVAPVLEGTVVSKRVLDDKKTGLLRIDEDPMSCWCVFDRDAPIFRGAAEGTKVATLALPIGLVGDELFFLDVSETLPAANGPIR